MGEGIQGDNTYIKHDFVKKSFEYRNVDFLTLRSTHYQVIIAVGMIGMKMEKSGVNREEEGHKKWKKKGRQDK